MKKRITKAERLRLLAQEIDDEARSAEECASSEKSALAEYVASVGYGDCEVKTGNLDEPEQSMVCRLKEWLKPKAFRRVMERVCVLETHGEYAHVSNSIFSATHGEYEHQLDCDLGKRVKALSEKDRETVRKLTKECYLPHRSADFVYLSVDVSFHMVVNTDRLEQAFKGVKATRAKNEIRENVSRLESHDQRRAVFRLIHGGAA